MAVVQNPTLWPAGDVAATRQVLDSLDGPAVLVGHSYGGVVITEAGNHPNVAAFAPDKGESVGSLIADPSPGAPVPPILPPSAPCPSGPARSSPRPPGATPSTSPARPSWQAVIAQAAHGLSTPS